MQKLVREKIQLNEGIHDPNILKVFFIVGGMGSGKSTKISQLFAIPQNIGSSVSYNTGIKLVNSDIFYEIKLKAAGYELNKLDTYAEDDIIANKLKVMRNRAKELTHKKQASFIEGRLGQIIEGTGKSYTKIEKLVSLYRSLGYDAYMIYINVPLELSLKRNRLRGSEGGRKVPDNEVQEFWHALQSNLGGFQNLFGRDKFIIIDSTDDDLKNDRIVAKTQKIVQRFLRQPVENQIGIKWINDQKYFKK